MSAPLPPEAMVGVVGAGAMGAGIAQVAARAGHRVVLVDANPAAVTAALARTGDDLGRLVERGKLAPADRAACLARMHAGTGSGDLADAALVIEAIVERLDAKIGLLRDLEAVVGPETILATNTSSLSVTAIAAGLSRPERCAGFHFFNPAPVMRLVEVVPGAQTDSAIAHTLKATAERWGKVAVFAKSTPGFIVNRVARPFYGEALRLLEEQICDAATLDALFVEGAGFRMGPCELMDLIGHDVNFAVTRSVFEACFHDPRYRPSQLQRDLVDAGWLGRKAGRGFFHYRDGREKPSPKSEFGRESAAPLRLPEPGAGTMIGRTWLTCSDGRPAALVAEARKGPVVLHDLVRASGSRVGLAASRLLFSRTVRVWWCCAHWPCSRTKLSRPSCKASPLSRTSMRRC